jgi:hypothetical protein
MICWILQDALQPIGFDGVELANVSTDGLPDAFFAPLRRTSSGSLRRYWSAYPVFEPGWELKLELSSHSGTRRGYFSLLRNHSRDLLLVDLNLLTVGFPAALSGAIERAMLRSQPTPRETELQATPQLVKVTSASSAD